MTLLQKSINIPTSWLLPDSLQTAKRVQEEMSLHATFEDDLPSLQFIGGVDISNNRFDPAKMLYAAAVVGKFNKDQLVMVDQMGLAERETFPYVPGFLGFREAPVLVKTLQQLKTKPDVILVDGHGYSHPRKLGIATHLGILTGIPTIGVAKSILVGSIVTPDEIHPGAIGPLMWKGEKIGVALWTKRNAHPLIISSGYKVNLSDAIALVLKCLNGYRLPEPTRWAHQQANILRKQYLSTNPTSFMRD